MNRLAAAHAEFVAALRAERAEIDRLLETLAAAVPAAEPGEARNATPARSAGRSKAKRGKNAHGVPGRPGVVQGERKGRFTCPGCGRAELPKNSGPGGYMAWHRAPCGLICASINLDRVDPEERAEGVHSRKNCPKCVKAAEAQGNLRKAATA